MFYLKETSETKRPWKCSLDTYSVYVPHSLDWSREWGTAADRFEYLIFLRTWNLKRINDTNFLHLFFLKTPKYLQKQRDVLSFWTKVNESKLWDVGPWSCGHDRPNFGFTNCFLAASSPLTTENGTIHSGKSTQYQTLCQLIFSTICGVSEL